MSLTPTSHSKKMKTPCWAIGVKVVLIIFIIFSIALLAIGSRLRMDAGKTTSVGGFAKASCTLTDVQVVQCSPTGAWTAVWRRRETAGSVAQNPFASRPTRELALADTNDYPLNVTMECMCDESVRDSYPNVNCQLTNACMMEVSMIEYMQHVGTVYGYSGDTLIAIGSLLLVGSLVGLIFVLKGMCCPVVGESKKANDVYVLDDSKE